eukprot:CAMPEP_0116888080 /NCGR_PEP_ID=MMETSP0463-20121206/22872_1 /TAXON_ID=181622 /ORGANISM="Strombidinopsis sp, Strain SopsisLIS2011" /LENGTH=48 /DNA_ID= /DNA_START= /DNA_END= /DNA_ORIENTATION=
MVMKAQAEERKRDQEILKELENTDFFSIGNESEAGDDSRENTRLTIQD